MNSPESARARIALDLIATAASMGAAEAANESHLVKIHDPETGDDSFWGPYPNAAVAAEAAERIVAGLNRGVSGSDLPFQATIHHIAAENPTTATRDDLRALGDRLLGVVDGDVDEVARWIAPAVDQIVARNLRTAALAVHEAADAIETHDDYEDGLRQGYREAANVVFPDALEGPGR